MEMAEEEILVTRREYEEEQKLVSQLETQLTELESKWLERTRGLILVSPEEYRREVNEIRRLETQLRELWSRWGRYMWLRRETLRRGEERRAAAYLGLIRRIRSDISTIQRTLTAARTELSRKTVITPELQTLRAQLEETQRKLEYERDRLERKVIANKLIAMHKRWVYDSPRGPYHDISIEAVASMIIDSDEPKEKYEETLKKFIEDEMYKTPGFERLTDLTEKVEGFEEKLVHPRKHPLRGPELHTLEWWHTVFTVAQLKLEDFLPR
jgi:hypothetical protein